MLLMLVVSVVWVLQVPSWDGWTMRLLMLFMCAARPLMVRWLANDSARCCRVPLLVRWLAYDAADHLGDAGCLSSLDGWPMMLLMLVFFWCGCCRVRPMIGWQANDAAEACRVFD